MTVARQRRDYVIATGAALMLGLALGAGWMQVTAGPGTQAVDVLWAADVTPAERARAEADYGLVEGSPYEGRMWQYASMEQRSRSAIGRLLHDPRVQGAYHIDHEALQVELDRPDLPWWLRMVLQSDHLDELSLLCALAAMVGAFSVQGLLREVTCAMCRAAAGDGAKLAGAAVALLIGGIAMSNRLLYVDEAVHLGQIQRFVSGSWSLEPSLTTPPLFHALVAAMLRPFHPSLGAARVAVLAVSMATIGAFYWVARLLDSSSAGLRVLQFVFLPILFPQFFLVYTDVTALLLLLLMFWATWTRRFGLAGLMGLLACATRQQSIVWVVFALVSAVLRERTVPRPTVAQLVWRYRTFLITGGLFLGFVVTNGGQVALGDVDRHELGAVYLTNVFFALFLTFVLFLPLWWERASASMALLRQPSTWCAGAILFVLFWFGFRVDHPYNRDPDFLRNVILASVTASAAHKVLFFVPVAFGALALSASPLSQPPWLLYGASVLVLLPEWLVEQRYYLMPMTAFILTRTSASPRVERLQAGFAMCVALVLYVLVQRSVMKL